MTVDKVKKACWCIDDWGKNQIQCRRGLANSQNYAAGRKKKDFMIKTGSFHQTTLQGA